MFSFWQANLFFLFSIIAIGLHWFNVTRGHKLAFLERSVLEGMFNSSERNMAYLCAVMLPMCFGAWGLMWLMHLAAWPIVAIQFYAMVRAGMRARKVYGL